MTSLFSHSHARHAQHLDPATSKPPASFTRGSGNPFRSSLKKIPSAMFARQENSSKDKKEDGRQDMKRDETYAGLDFHYGPLRHPPNQGKSPEKIKTRAKTRKALADLFSWGNSTSSPSKASAQPRKQPAPPSPPSKEPVKKPSMVLKKNPPKSIPLKPSNIRLSSGTSLLSVADSHAGTIRRPSLGADPFSRSGDGAEVVQQVERHSTSTTASVKRRSSFGSSQPLSSKTLFDVAESAEKAPSHSSTVVHSTISPPTAHIKVDGVQQAAPLVLADEVLDTVPVRSASLGRVLEAPKSISSSPKFVRRFQHPIVPTSTSEDDKTLKQKTKSRIWGILGGRSRKAKDQNPENIREDPPRVEEIKQRPHPSTEPIAYSAAQNSPKYDRAQLLQDTLPIPGQLPVRPTVPTKKHSIKRKQPPTFHITQPSMDTVLVPVSSAQKSSDLHVPSDQPRHEDPASTKSSQPRGSAETKQAIEALMGPRALPKRPSLTGLFGIAIRRSIDKLDQLYRDATTTTSQAPSAYGDKAVKSRAPSLTRLRSLAEEVDEVGSGPSFHRASPPYRSRFGNSRLELAQQETPSNAAEATSSPGLQYVASATDKLSNFVAGYKATPVTSPSVPSSQPSLEEMVSFSQQSPSASPTPFRRTRSAVLSTRASGSPLKPGKSNVSPLKFALHRAHKMASQDKFGIKDRSMPAQPAAQPAPPTSMVKQGMRNIFAPPSPPGVKISPATASASISAAAPITDIGVGLDQTMGRSPVTTKLEAWDIPADLRAVLGDHHIPAPPSPNQTSTLGLPPRPPADRHVPRRPARVPPKISLPPVPVDQTPVAAVSASRSSALQLPVDFTRNLRPHSMFSDSTSVTDKDWRYSFDFTSEYASLDQGDQRASFVDARHHIEATSWPAVDVDLPPLPAPAAGSNVGLHTGNLAIGCQQVLDVSQFDDAPPPSTSKRRVPFQGEFAFQQRVSAAKQTGHGLATDQENDGGRHTDIHHHAAPDDAHRGDESNLSIATMSSVGATIERGIAGEHVQCFERKFDQHIAAANRGMHSSQNSVDSTYGSLNVQDASSLYPRMNSNDTTHRGQSRRAHHRRNSSILSVDSIGGVDDSLFASSGPPVSMFNRRGSGYLSRHRRQGSEESIFGRSDWAAHRRNSSADSAVSNVSASRIIRPGLGDRMFQLDGGVQLTSITGSPAENTEESRPASILDRRNSNDSLLDGSSGLLYDSLLDADASRYTDMDSIFGVENRSPHPPSAFILKGMRPVSMISSSSASDSLEDSRINVVRYGANAMAKSEVCLEGEGEDTSTLHFMPGTSLESRPRSALALSGSSMSRPSKPRGAHRRRPAQLALSDHDADTPGLTSPSASETSSRLSLETKFSDGSSILTASRIRAPHKGHQRGRSSAGVQLQATIREEPSTVTLRASKTSSSPTVARAVVPSQPTLRASPRVIQDGGENDGEDDLSRMLAVKSWLQFEREAGEEYRRTKNEWKDSEESKLAIAAEFVRPRSPTEILQFLAQSTANYKPLEQLPMGRKIAHRRKSSLSDSRAMVSPYGIPQFKAPHPPRPRNSLITKFERTSSAPSSASVHGDGEVIAPTGVFAQFVQQVAPSPPPFGRPPGSAQTGSLDVSLPVPPSSATQSEFHHQRERVNSNVRRQALGWGKRRNSDGPVKVVGYRERDVRGLQPLALVGSANVPSIKLEPSQTKVSSNTGAIKSGVVKEPTSNFGDQQPPPIPVNVSAVRSGINKENDPRRPGAAAKHTSSRKLVKRTSRPALQSLRA